MHGLRPQAQPCQVCAVGGDAGLAGQLERRQNLQGAAAGAGSNKVCRAAGRTSSRPAAAAAAAHEARASSRWRAGTCTCLASPLPPFLCVKADVAGGQPAHQLLQRAAAHHLGSRKLLLPLLLPLLLLLLEQLSVSSHLLLLSCRRRWLHPRRRLMGGRQGPSQPRPAAGCVCRCCCWCRLRASAASSQGK